MSKRRSFTAELKLEIVKYAEDNGSNRAAAKFYNVEEKSIRNWRKEKPILEKMPKRKRARRGSGAKWPELEVKLKEWILNERSNKRKVSTIGTRLKAIVFAREMNLVGFKGSPHWCHKFMKRNALSVRAVTSVGQSLPEDWEEKTAAFRVFFKKLLPEVSHDQIGNMDEVPVSFDIPDSRTVNPKGEKNILISTTGAEKLNFTVVLAETADGEKLSPMVIFKRKTMPKETFPKGIHVFVNEKGWMNDYMMKNWLEKVWKPRKGAFFTPKSILIYDSAKAHLTDDVKKEVGKHSKLAVIPGGLTKMLQPLDLTTNRSFKSKMRVEWEKWMVDGMHTFTKGGRMRRATYAEVCSWVLTSWNAVTPECIKNGFKKANLGLFEDPDLEEQVDDETEGDDEGIENINNLEGVANLVRDYEIEMTTGDDFDGF